jgi:hypothetical protein
MNLNRLTRAGQCQMIAVERAQPGVVERVVVETAKPFAPRIVRPNPFLELILDASIAESSNAATVKKNQKHGSRSGRQPHGKFWPSRDGKVGTAPFTFMWWSLLIIDHRHRQDE